MKHCNNCGAKNEDTAFFCKSCKSELSQNIKNNYFEEEVKKDNFFGFLKNLKMLSIFIVACLIVLLFAGIILTIVL